MEACKAAAIDDTTRIGVFDMVDVETDKARLGGEQKREGINMAWANLLLDRRGAPASP